MIAPYSILICAAVLSAADKPGSPQMITHQVTGLFSIDRVKDLQSICNRLPDFSLVSVSFDTSEAVFRYDPSKHTAEQLDNLLKQASHNTFGIKPLCKVPRDKLERVEIPVVGLDCKACCLAVYEIVAKLDGVEHATASFKDGLVVAWIHPEKIGREKLEKALLAREVSLKNRPAK